MTIVRVREMMPPMRTCLCSLLALALTTTAAAAAATLVPSKSAWRYQKGTTEASTPNDAWRRIEFSDEAWPTGPAPFYYGETIIGGTVISDMRNSYSCVFFRESFRVDNPELVRELRLRALCDDGFIAWINEVEVARYNMPAGLQPYNGLAQAAVAEPVAFADYILPPPVYLRAGTNVLAVQVFNNSLTSSDLQWDAELTAAALDTEAPRVASVEPSPGVVEQLAQITITFSEPVTGVTAPDLLLGGQPAASVSGSGARYVFAFGGIQSGPVELRWDFDVLITDLASPANRFDPAAAGPWSFEIRDVTAPTVIQVRPNAGATVSRLSEVELLFNEPIQGVDAADLRLNGLTATNLTGAAAGPYVFQFPPASAGQAQLSWAVDHGISDRAGNLFAGHDWAVTVDPDAVAWPVRINELLASNLAGTGLKDEDGELQDWIEILNEGSAPVNLQGWSLTDDRNDPDRWIFPARSLGPGEFLVVFASGKDRRPISPTGKLHANFKLNPAGEYLALLSPDSPRLPASEFAPYPEQRNDYSYGFDAAKRPRYFRTPTPGAANGESAIEGVVPPPEMNIGRGWFDAPFTLTVTSALAGATLRYTTDGSEPTEANSVLYTGPIEIATTTTLRVAAFDTNMLPSAVETHTYLFPAAVLLQPNKPAGYPSGAAGWGGYPADYEMDPEIVTNALYSGSLRPALLALPTLSIVCRIDDLFGAANGIYTHPTSRGPSWERPCSVEFIPNDGSAGFQANAGVQIQGNASREPQKQPKHPFRLVFKGDYGPRRLEYRMFPDSPITLFDTLVLRADFNYSWLHWSPQQRIRAQRTRDAWLKDTMRAMGGLATHNRYVHLFINGLYWGVYDPSERPDGAFGAAYLGGEKEEYDVMNEGEVVDGARQAYDAMLAMTDLSTPSALATVQRYLDLDQYIDYMLLHFYAGHGDWGQNKNWYAIRPKSGARGFFYVPWDGEVILDDPSFNRVVSTDTPSGLHTRLTANPEYRLRFADHAHKHLFNAGALTLAAVEARWRKRAQELDLAITAESARWGDYRRDVHPFQTGPYELYTRDNQWRAEQKRLLTQYFPTRTATVLNQLRSASLYPTLAAPEFSRSGGVVSNGFTVTLEAPAGTIYVTTNGSDPRLAGGAIAPGAARYSGPIVLVASIVIKARALQQGVWSALAEAEYHVAEPLPPIRFTEIMYHPLGGDAYEFVELRNCGAVPVDIGGYSVAGADYVFPHGTVLAASHVVVLASALSPAAFAERYPTTTVTGYFRGTLSNAGERLVLRDRDGRPVTSITYNDSRPWPDAADGHGFSIEVIDPFADANAPANWRSSQEVYGTPGVHLSAPTAPGIRLNEVSAATAAASAPTSADWIELFNASDVAMALEGWTLADESGRTFTFRAGSTLGPRAFLVVLCDADNAEPGFHAPFRLDQDGETVALFTPESRRVDAVSFGPQLAGFTLARLGDNSAWRLSLPTPGAENEPAELAPAAALRINEWLPNPAPGRDDWIELYNTDLARPATLDGLYLSADRGLVPLPSVAFVAPGGFLRLNANEGAGPVDLGLKLPAEGGFVELLEASGDSVDRITYSARPEDEAEGRLPDGADTITVFPGGGSPGQSNDPDRDRDGLPDAWERANGTNPDLSDADADPDGDGLTNAQELAAGTNPRDANSLLALRPSLSPSGSVQLEFTAAAGHSYSVYYSDQLATNSWRKLQDVPASETARVEALIDATSTASARFYRVVTPAQR